MFDLYLISFFGLLFLPLSFNSREAGTARSSSLSFLSASLALGFIAFCFLLCNGENYADVAFA